MLEEIEGNDPYSPIVTQRQKTAFRVHQFFELAKKLTFPGAFRTRAPSSSVSLFVMGKKLAKTFEEIEGNHSYFAIVTRHDKTAFCVHDFLELAIKITFRSSSFQPLFFRLFTPLSASFIHPSPVFFLLGS